jgi:hypothetical protein
MTATDISRRYYSTKQRNTVKCAVCIFKNVDKKSSVSGIKAYECTNPKSDFYKSLLNASYSGIICKKISHRGCEHGMIK